MPKESYQDELVHKYEYSDMNTWMSKNSGSSYNPEFHARILCVWKGGGRDVQTRERAWSAGNRDVNEDKMSSEKISLHEVGESREPRMISEFN